jgi:hypothetical protein
MQPDITAVCAEIRYQYRQRNYAMEQRKRADLALGSFLRLMLGWSLNADKETNDAARDRAAELIAIGEGVAKKGAAPGEDAADFIEWRDVIAASIEARKPFDKIEAVTTKRMEELARQLPVWVEWGADVRGFGARSLAVIVGEAGDLSNYPKKGHLWKRMGLAVIDGVRQGGLAKTAGAEAWIEHGYNRERRSRMFVIGDTLVKGGDEYRAVYLARKEYERSRATAAGLIVAPAAKIPAKRKDEFISDGHIHRMAQRYMEKRLLRDLWQAWNRGKASRVMPSVAGRSLPTHEPVAA